jgi:DNA-binding transcriptional ArsR family regulator
VAAETERVDEALHALADPTRRAILRLVRDHELAAGQVARHFPAMSRPAVSQHLRVLAGAGLIEGRAAGTMRLYRLRPEGLSEITATLDEMRSGPPAALDHAAEREERAARDARPGRWRGR